MKQYVEDDDGGTGKYDSKLLTPRPVGGALSKSSPDSNSKKRYASKSPNKLQTKSSARNAYGGPSSPTPKFQSDLKPTNDGKFDFNNNLLELKDQKLKDQLSIINE